MIPVSLLLILVAVALLVLGLTAGSSGLLIASIVASLLAAVALVIGARRTAGARRPSAGRPVPPEAAPPESEAASPEFMAEFAAAPAAPPPPASGLAQSGPASSGAGAMAEEDFARPGAAFAADSGDYPTPEHRAASDDLDPDDELRWPPGRSTQPIDESEVAAATGADYDWAATAIHGARSEQPDENAWRRDTHAESAAHAGVPGLHEEFAEADADDPDDEPLPQAVEPADAVRVARMDAEVLVVDGRPRYHLADCAHLVGRLTEPIGVNEAIELGFTPCGLCRPVERLVAAARH